MASWHSSACSSGYKLNPVTRTCIRLVQELVTWDTAKTRCEAGGEYLAVFPSLKSVHWLDSILRDPNIAGGKPMAVDHISITFFICNDSWFFRKGLIL